MINTNKYFDFKTLFYNIIFQEQESIKKFRYESETYSNLDDFLGDYELYDISKEDCSINSDNTFLFVFHTKNDNILDRKLVEILFDNTLSEFTKFEIS
jgi:hypothetical protein